MQGMTRIVNCHARKMVVKEGMFLTPLTLILRFAIMFEKGVIWMSDEQLPEELKKIVNMDYETYRTTYAKRPPMPNAKRAAQFTPFAALKGMDHIYTDTGKEHLEGIGKWDNRKY